MHIRVYIKICCKFSSHTNLNWSCSICISNRRFYHLSRRGNTFVLCNFFTWNHLWELYQAAAHFYRYNKWKYDELFLINNCLRLFWPSTWFSPTYCNTLHSSFYPACLKYTFSEAIWINQTYNIQDRRFPMIFRQTWGSLQMIFLPHNPNPGTNPLKRIFTCFPC